MGRPAQERELRGLLATRGVRPTGPRLAVLGELAREEGDLTAQTLWRRLHRRGGRVGLATVYRTLAILTETGIVDALSHHGSETCYRLCGEGHHHHLVCSGCHRVVEVEGCALDDWLEQVSAEHGFVTTGHVVELTGVCANCRAA
jgi:Fur family ferric uptake transcriptional regulator